MLKSRIQLLAREFRQAADRVAEFDQRLDFGKACELKLVVVAGLAVALSRGQPVATFPLAQAFGADAGQLYYGADSKQTLVFHCTHDLYKGGLIVQQ